MKKKYLRFVVRVSLMTTFITASLFLLNNRYKNNSIVNADTKTKYMSFATYKVLEPIHIPEPIKPIVATKVIPKVVHSKTTPSRGMDDYSNISELGVFKLTAYDLSVQSCGKSKSDSAYGITKTGYNLEYENLLDRKIAVDANVIKLNSKVYIVFPESRRYVWWYGEKVDLNGYYKAVDTGGAIRGNRIDLFIGGTDEFVHQLCYKIGVVKVKVYR